MKITDYDTNTEIEECSSILCLQADVKRFNAVQLHGEYFSFSSHYPTSVFCFLTNSSLFLSAGFNERGQKQVVEATGYVARIIQHEMDHLNGILFTDQMTTKTLKCGIWKEINAVNGYIELSFYPRA